MTIVSVFNNPDEALNKELRSGNFYLFFIELVVLIYGAFFDYNRLVPRKQYTAIIISLIALIVCIAWFDD